MKRHLVIAIASGLLAACSHSGYGLVRSPAVSAEEVAAGPSPQENRGMYLDLIRRMQSEGAYYASLAHIQAYRQRYSDSPALRVLEAEALRRTGSLEQADAIYRGLTKGPEAAEAWHGMGLIAATQERSADAEYALEKAVQLDPLNSDYLGDLGFNWMRDGQLELAREPLAKATELAPGNTRAAANLALWTLLKNQPGQAEALMRQAKLPDATRNEIYRLAGTLRNARPRPAPTSNAGVARNSQPATGATAPVNAGNPNIPAPRSMLERFGNPTSSSTESTP